MSEDKNISNLKPFKKGEDTRRNTTGKNKGSKWNSTLLKKLMTVDLSDNEMDSFKEFSEKFPNVFDSTEEKNFQFFMELKQLSLVFNSDAKVSQAAINAIKDRIDGKPKQKVDVEFENKTKLTPEERKQRIAELTRKANELNG